MTPEAIRRAVIAAGLDGVAITDHNAILGALELQAVASFPVIVGEEIKTTEGEITGLFLSQCIPPGLSPEEAIAAIREQGGLVCVPHPMDRLRNSAIGRCVLERIVAQVDIIEVFNARMLLPQDNTRAREFARLYGLAMAAGSDAHLPCEIGHGYVQVDTASGPVEFLDALRHGRTAGTLTTPLAHLLTSLIKFRRRSRGGQSNRDRES